ncbi:hypothetical protein PBY51_016874 [Eleginops maclovinus]|uniref:Uncharacterized protein n=1 Tax=Eleginops maclovinus TaxID=56733 RepID=A0AAN7W967_ELEMC|nr:hypothetical protein PBY51_016874 [Eleginops maclovinus]
MLQSHYMQGTSLVLAARPRVTPAEQGEPDRNNTINQTRFSLKSLFLWVANLLPEGGQADVTAADKKKRTGDP